MAGKIVLESWAETFFIILILVGFFVALLINSPILSYMVIILSGLLAGRFFYKRRFSEPIFPFILIIIGFLLGFMLIPRIWSTTLPAMPFTFLITIFSLPLALKLWHRAVARKNPKNPLDFAALDGATSQMNLLFGLLCTGALLLHHFTEKLL